MSRKTLSESLKEVLGQTTEITEKKTPKGDDEEKSVKDAKAANKEKPKTNKIDTDADSDDETKSVKKADVANGLPTKFHKGKDGKPTKEEVEMTDKTIDETAALDTIHPKAGSNGAGDPMSKIEMMSKALGAMSVMSPGDLTSWFTKAIENSKHYSSATDGKADSNRDTLDMKPSNATTSSAPKIRESMPKLGVKEDVEAALAGFELSEETTDKLTTLFEAAVTARVIMENAVLEEAFEEKLNEAIEEISEDLSDQVDNYLTYVVEHFMKENEVAIESSLRNQIASDFIAGIKDVFEAFVDVPEAKVEVVEALSDKIVDLEARFNEQLEKNSKLEEALVEIERERIVEGFAEGLALSEADKFLKLAEGVSFDGDIEAYSKKLSVIKEQYFGEKKAPAKTNITEETFEGETSEVKMDPNIARYMASIDRVLKK